ncbi:hypothetical protein DMC30DRAFT_409775 [Rhodotorula diobovata]|uniref:Ribosome biogenesis protein SLX9 n=1 Tax=Rhodotorula diobovata TaxID=5288 RepID=A0A5C5FLZ1_9BASI|nr:hypothetical protein DMC30DRAFT_409775 [Rhodotorula diobovata]
MVKPYFSEPHSRYSPSLRILSNRAQPRPTRQRTSLPSHSRSAQLVAPDALADSYSMSSHEMAPIAAVKAAQLAQLPAQLVDDEQGPPKPKQTKADKAYHRRKELLDKVTASATPYSKSHARRLRRHAQPANNLVASLAEVEAVLPHLGDDDDDEGASAGEEEGEEEEGAEGYEDDAMEGGQGKKAKTGGGKGREKLTAKKRQRVLLHPLYTAQHTHVAPPRDSTTESARLPAIIKNDAFAKSPFATIRQHTLNTLIAQKDAPGLGQQGKGTGKGKGRGRAGK